MFDINIPHWWPMRVRKYINIPHWWPARRIKLQISLKIHLLEKTEKHHTHVGHDRGKKNIYYYDSSHGEEKQSKIEKKKKNRHHVVRMSKKDDT